MPGDDPDQPVTDTETPPADTFALVSHEIRAEIIQVLGRNELSLYDLRSQLDTDVEPSQLHYHLQQLVGHFVEKTDDGYQLNSVGRRLSLTIRAGSFDCRSEHMVVDANFDCHDCQAPVEVIFNNGQVRIVCPECELQYMLDYFQLSLAMFEDEGAAFSHFKQYQTLKMLFMAHKICFNCANLLSPTFFDPEERGILHEYENLKVVIDLECDQCGEAWWQSVGMALRADMALISFCYDHGVDILSTPHWELEFAMTDNYVTVRSTDPWEVALEVTYDDETLELIVDGDLNVLERNRLHASELTQVVLPDKKACLQSLRRHRWADGVTCPSCSSMGTTKRGRTSKNAQRYRCHNCDSTFNDLTDTIFANHRLTIPEMFYIVREMDETPATEVARQLDRSYPSVLAFINEIQDTCDEEFEFGLSEVCDADTIP